MLEDTFKLLKCFLRRHGVTCNEAVDMRMNYALKATVFVCKKFRIAENISDLQ